MSNEKFESVYNRLNTTQKQAVDTIYGPVMVIVGPWSGKTELLSARVANILLQTDVNPSNILCLAFTDNAAKSAYSLLLTQKVKKLCIFPEKSLLLRM